MTEEELQAHAAYTALEQGIPALKEAIADGANEAFAGNLQDCLNQAEFLLWSLQQSEPELLTENLLKPVQSETAHLSSGQFITNRNTDGQVIPSFNQSLANQLESAIKALPGPLTRKFATKETTSKVRSVENEAQKVIADLRKQFADEIASVEKTAQTKQAEAEKATENLKTEIAGLKDKLTTEQARVQQLETEVSEAKANTKAAADTKSVEFDQLIKDRKEQLDEWKDGIESEGNDLLTKIEETYRLSSSTALAGEFIDASRSEWKAYFAHTLITIGVGLFATAVGYFAVQAMLTTESSTSSILLRLAVLAPIAFVMVFSANAANKHRQSATAYRTLGVRIQTLKPYIDHITNGVDINADELKALLLHFFSSELVALKKSTPKNGISIDDIDKITDLASKLNK